MANYNISNESLSYINNFINKITSKLEFSPKEKDDFIEEMKSNLLSSIEDLIDQGKQEKEAVELAIKRFGDSFLLRDDLKVLNKESDRLNKIYTIMGLTVGAVFSLVGIFTYIPPTEIFFPILALITGYAFVIVYLINKKNQDSKGMSVMGSVNKNIRNWMGLLLGGIVIFSFAIRNNTLAIVSVISFTVAMIVALFIIMKQKS